MTKIYFLFVWELYRIVVDNVRIVMVVLNLDKTRNVKKEEKPYCSQTHGLTFKVIKKKKNKEEEELE